MKFLLVAINAKYIHSNPAVYSLKAYAGAEYENEIEIAEYTINNPMGDILSGLYKRRPDVAAFSCYIWNWRLVQELAAELHKIMPGLPIWLGGPEVSFNSGSILEGHEEITGIMAGEGEETFRELFTYYKEKSCGKGQEAKNGLEGIAGIIFRQAGQIINTGEREPVNMDCLPFLYKKMDSFQNKIIYYESSRGCPFRCSYCLSSIDKSVRFRHTETVKKELQLFLDEKVAQVKFVDRTFNCSHEHTMEIWQYLAAHDNGITNFHFEIAADRLDDEEIAVLSQMRSGLVQLEIGVQSANPVTLRAIDRFADMERLKETVECLHRGNNVHIHLDLIAGLPYEDYKSFGQSFDVVYGMKPEQLQLGFLKVLKGSPMYGRAEEYGIKYMSMPPYEVLRSRWLSFEDVCRLKRIEEMVELYYNSSQFAHTLPVLESLFASPFSMFEKLADYYEENGYFVNSPSRQYRYEVLLEFALRYGKGQEELYKELLTYDIYLRENMKSRPYFAKDLSAYKERFWDFYNKDEELRGILPGYEGYQPKQIARMTHMEVFAYPVWSAGGHMEKTGTETMVLFDYGKRNPLTKEAETTVIEGKGSGWHKMAAGRLE